MKDLTIFVRYCGTSANRFHILQRGDGQIWTGEGWSRIMDCAAIFRSHKDAQQACASLARQRYGGKPVRTFRMEVAVALVADEVDEISQEQLSDFIARAVRVDVENSVHNDGPVEGSYVQLRLLLATLKETETTRKRF